MFVIDDVMRHLTSLICLTLTLLFTQAQCCERLDADSDISYFDSHDFYGIFDYPNHYEECWIITAPSGKRVEVWSDDLQTESCFDPLKAFCGDSISDTLIDRYCEHDNINDIVSYDRHMRIEFSSDGSGTNNGFRVYYKAVSGSKRSSCHDAAARGIAIAVIVGIVISVLVVIAIIVAVIICCVVNNNKHRGMVHPHGAPTVTTISRPGATIISAPRYGVAPGYAPTGVPAYGAPNGFGGQPLKPPPYGGGQPMQQPGFNVRPLNGAPPSYNQAPPANNQPPPAYNQAQGLTPVMQPQPPLMQNRASAPQNQPAAPLPQPGGQYPPSAPSAPQSQPSQPADSVFPPAAAVYNPPPPPSNVY